MESFTQQRLRLLLIAAIALGCSSATLSGTLAALTFNAETPAVQLA